MCIRTNTQENAKSFKKSETFFNFSERIAEVLDSKPVHQSCICVNAFPLSRFPLSPSSPAMLAPCRGGFAAKFLSAENHFLFADGYSKLAEIVSATARRVRFEFEIIEKPRGY